jgi:hypothetical protein
VSLSCDFDKYVRLLKPVASLSHLFSDNDTPYVSPKFVERLYMMSAGARDTAGDNSSFDAIAPVLVGVGVKTFVAARSARHKFEKIAEFTADANAGVFDGLDSEQLLRKAIELRNARLSSDAIAYGINVSNAIYHCLIRLEGAAMIHEEPMSLVNVSMLHPSDADGKPLAVLSEKPVMSDGRNVYSFNKSKRVLYKRFPVVVPPPPEFGGMIQLPINRRILDQLLEGGGPGFIPSSDAEKHELASTLGLGAEVVYQQSHVESEYCVEDAAQALASPEVGGDFTDEMIINKPANFVILPLYSPRENEVAEKSGINQWNAGGRVRTFGEAYIPVPAWIHSVFPGFFPNRDRSFRLRLQDGTVVSAKICQQGSKALMSDPNDVLCRWLYTAIEPELSYDQIKRRLPESRPYTYKDLIKVGKDCVKVSKVSGKGHQYELTFCKLGDYVRFEQAAARI